MLISKIRKYINFNNLISHNSSIVVGLSGGPDSICMLDILHKLSHKYNIKLLAVHINHNWRSKEETDLDLKVCQDICERLNIQLISKSLDLQDLSGSKEAIARKVRREIFEQVLLEHNASAIALAQHRDDQIETFFIRLIRGSNITGLSSIRSKSGFYIRPLLDISKQEIYEYLKANNLAYTVDSTNLDNIFLRNGLRNCVIPELNKLDSRFTINCLKTINMLQETDDFISRIVSSFLSQNTITYNNQYLLNIKSLLAQDQYLHKSIILQFLILSKAPINSYLSSNYLDEIIKFLKSQANSHIINPKLVLIKQKIGKVKYLGIKN